MDRKISFIIDGKKYNVTAHNEEQEQMYRRAAATINAKMESFSNSHPDRQRIEIMTLVALNESVRRFDLQNELESVKGEAGKLSQDLRDYLSSQEK